MGSSCKFRVESKGENRAGCCGPEAGQQVVGQDFEVVDRLEGDRLAQPHTLVWDLGFGGSEAGSYIKLIDVGITQLQACD